MITFDSSAATGVVSDKVRAASRIFASSAHSHQDQGVREGGPSISDGKITQLSKGLLKSV